MQYLVIIPAHLWAEAKGDATREGASLRPLTKSENARYAVAESPSARWVSTYLVIPPMELDDRYEWVEVGS
jgi:hypothetical protein